jgi:hypothetical protein
LCIIFSPTVGNCWDPDPEFLKRYPHHVDADPDPDPACHFDAGLDPDSTFHFDAHLDPDTDPSLQIKAQSLDKVIN